MTIHLASSSLSQVKVGFQSAVGVDKLSPSLGLRPAKLSFVGVALLSDEVVPKGLGANADAVDTKRYAMKAWWKLIMLSLLLLCVVLLK